MSSMELKVPTKKRSSSMRETSSQRNERVRRKSNTSLSDISASEGRVCESSWSRGAAAKAFHDGYLSDEQLENISSLDELNQKGETKPKYRLGSELKPPKRQNSGLLRRSFGKLRNKRPVSNVPQTYTVLEGDYDMLKEKCKKLAQEEIKLQKRIEDLKEKEKELLESCSRLSSINGSPASLLRKKPKDAKTLKVDSRIIHIRERLGSGASGAVVYSCLVDGWVCAMKKLTREEKVEIESFEREMAILYKLPHHPNIVKYLFHACINGKMCLFMTKHTSTLQRIIHTKNLKEEPFNETETRSIAAHIIQGIAFLHKNHIIHRDIKTENVYCTPTSTGELNEVVVADFDTAKRTGVGNQPQSTIGTLGYMAPEVFNNKIHATGYDYSADIFSFGMVLYSLISLKEPFHNIGNPFLIYEKLENGILPEYTDKQIDSFSEELIQLQRDCIQMDPAARPSTADILVILQSKPNLLSVSDAYASLSF